MVESLLDPVAPGPSVRRNQCVEGLVRRSGEVVDVSTHRVNIETVVGRVSAHNASPPFDLGVRRRVFPSMGLTHGRRSRTKGVRITNIGGGEKIREQVP